MTVLSDMTPLFPARSTLAVQLRVAGMVARRLFQLLAYFPGVLFIIWTCTYTVLLHLVPEASRAAAMRWSVLHLWDLRMDWTAFVVCSALGMYRDWRRQPRRYFGLPDRPHMGAPS